MILKKSKAISLHLLNSSKINDFSGGIYQNFIQDFFETSQSKTKTEKTGILRRLFCPDCVPVRITGTNAPHIPLNKSPALHLCGWMFMIFHLAML
jgi:hypothetical protein